MKKVIIICALIGACNQVHAGGQPGDSRALSAHFVQGVAAGSASVIVASSILSERDARLLGLGTLIAIGCFNESQNYPPRSESYLQCTARLTGLTVGGILTLTASQVLR